MSNPTTVENTITCNQCGSNDEWAVEVESRNEPVCRKCARKFAVIEGKLAAFDGKSTTENPYLEDGELSEYWLEGFAGNASNLASAVMSYFAGDRIVMDDDLPDATNDFVEISFDNDLTSWFKSV